MHAKNSEIYRKTKIEATKKKKKENNINDAGNTGGHRKAQ